ncbi:hypothetical protein CspeluHIS016_0900490 [Cutaneotrichosporon spelunceum]|uniref:Uncharacterized protein n=1 Tax=Cutaneotrichosporon spelunceum TaxID=1672016 RepID=A0AAD3U0H6_9TREE|nr:hypothetical protein CspeluHIS016_0900490 [Cutaneotrichosporon spelunceum]
MSSLHYFQSALTAELASQGLSLEMVFGGADALVIRRVKAAALHTLLALYPPLSGDTGTILFLQADHRSAKDVLDASLALAAAYLELVEHVRVRDRCVDQNLNVTPMLRKAGIPPHPCIPQPPSNPCASTTFTHNLANPPSPRVRPWGVIEPRFSPPKPKPEPKPKRSLPLGQRGRGVEGEVAVPWVE